MKKLLLYGSVLLGLSLLLLIASAAWLLGTSGGARALLSAVSRFSPAAVEFRELQGRLLDELALEEAALRWPGGRAQVDRLELDWNLPALLRGRLEIGKLGVSGAEIWLREEEEPPEERTEGPPELDFPEVEGWAARLSAEVEAVRLDGLAVHRGGEDVLTVETLAGRLLWADRVLTVEGLEFASAEGVLSGEAAVDFGAPALTLGLRAKLAEEAAGYETFSLDVDLEPRPGARHLAGPVTAAAQGEGGEGLRLQAQVDWTAERLSLGDLRLSRTGASGEVRGDLHIREAEDWPFEVNLALADLDLAPETGTATDLSGTVRAEGTLQGFRGSFDLVNDVEGVQGGALAADFTGGSSEIVVTDLRGRWLEGQLSGELAAGWTEGWEISGALRGEGLNPAAVTAEWPGKINFRLQAAAAGGPQRPLSASVEGRLLESTLRGQALTGIVDVAAEEDEVRITELVLRGEGLDVAAEGRLKERIAFRARIGRLSALIPEAAGSLSAEGWVRWKESELSGTVSARGDHLAAAGLKVGRLEIEAAHPGGGAPFRVAAEMTEAAYADLRLRTVTLQGQGTVEAHRLQLVASGPDLDLRTAVRGGYSQESWKGRVLELATAGPYAGEWTLADPVSLVLSPGRIETSPLRLQGKGGAFLSAEADLRLDPRRGTVAASWGELDLSLANPWLPEIALSGSSSGSVRMEIMATDRLDLAASAELNGVFRKGGDRLVIRQGSADLAWGPEGLAAEAAFDLAELGTWSGRAASREPARFALPESGEAGVRWDLADLKGLSPWIPQVDLSGSSRGDVSGRWRADRTLEAKGEARMTGGVAYRDLQLEVSALSTEFSWDARGLAAEWELDLGDQGQARGQATSSAPARLEVPDRGEIDMRWEGVNLALLEPLAGGMEISGAASGDLQAGWESDRRLELAARVNLAGRLVREDLTLEVPRGEAEATWNGEGLRAAWSVALGPEGEISGRLTSAAPARLEAPERGEIEARWRGLDLALLRPWMPQDMLLEGALQGSLAGAWLPGQRLRAEGGARIRGGELQWLSEGGVLTAALDTAELRWQWLEQTLQGDLALALENYGRAEGHFRLPLPARVPTGIEPSGALEGALTATVQEKGLLNALFPGLVQESRGTVSLDLGLGGTWERPDLRGEMRLADAAAYLPATGIRLEEVQLTARLEGEQIRLVSLRARSGPGFFQGQGVLQLREWALESYRVEIGGENFELVDLPELQLQITPDLQVEGTGDRLAVRGVIRIPEMLVTGKETPTPVSVSPDVVIVDAPEPEAREAPLDLDVRVQIVLGEHVLVDAEGVDARLEGSLRLSLQGTDPERTTARGEIRVAQGRYSAYGVNLDIDRGHILFAGGPVDLPTLDITAIRKAGDVTAGVQVSGTPRNPRVELFSDPAMPDTDVLSYIVLGRPLGQGGGDAGALMLAAGALLSKGESAVLQDRLKRSLGVDVLEVESGNGDTAGSRITIGKYLGPDLYISFGQGLFANTQEARLRYDLSENWQLESSVGTESAVDLYYKIEFR